MHTTKEFDRIREHEQTLADFSEQLAEYGRRTGPADREALEQAVSRIYSFWRLEPPSMFIWLDTPVLAAAATLLLSQLGGLQIYARKASLPGQLLGHLRRRNSIRPSTPADFQGWFGQVLQQDLTEFNFDLVDKFSRSEISLKDLTAGQLTTRICRIEPLERAARIADALINNLAQTDFTPELQLNLAHSLWQEERRVVPQSQERADAEAEPRMLVFRPFGNTEKQTGAVCRSIDWNERIPFMYNCALADHDALIGLKYFQLSGHASPEYLGAFVDASAAGGWWWPLSQICVVSENPKILQLDQQGRVHCDDGPAISFHGLQTYAIEGRIISENVVRRTYSASDILAEPNIAVRQIMLERFGLDRFIAEANAKEFYRDRWGVLYRIELDRDEPLVVVEVVNSTPEPDGSYRKYYLRVPPDVTTAREAIAWSFGLDEDDYRPAAES